MKRSRNKHAANTPANAVHTLPDCWRKLEQSGWLARRSSEVRRLLYGTARIAQFEPDQAIYRVGDIPDGVYGLVSGGLDIAIPRIDGQEVVVHRAEPGFWVGDLALFAEQTRLVTLRAASRCLLVHLPQAALRPLVAEHAELVRDFYELTHQNMATTLRLLGNLAVTGADNRVALRLMVQHDSLADDAEWIRFSHETLAELVALSPQSVRRSIRRLEEAGLIARAYGRIRVLDRGGLARLCSYAELAT